MSLFVRDIMVTSFDTVNENALIGDAIQMIRNGRVRKTGYKSFSLMVVDDYKQLAGIITMYDILYHLRPDFLNQGIDADQLPWAGLLEHVLESLKKKTVKQVMSYNLVSAGRDEHVIVILDRMIKNKYRRLPVLDGNRLVGIIYLSDIYSYIFK